MTFRFPCSSVDYRMFNPDDPGAACTSHGVGPGTPPLPQNHEYEYVHSGYVHARRRKRQADGVDENDCVPTTGTDYCAATATFRRNEVHEHTRKLLFYDTYVVQFLFDHSEFHWRN